MKPHEAKRHFFEVDVELILKILALSAMLAIGIKSLGPLLSLPATTPVALTIVLFPTLAMGFALGWRSWQQR